MKGNERTGMNSASKSGSSQLKDGYSVLVPIQNSKEFDVLLPTAIDLATTHNGRVILLNIIEIPYQLPPSAAERFITERELLLSEGLDMLERAGCRGSSAVRIAHDKNDAIKQFSKDENVNIIIRERDLKDQADSKLKRFKSWIKSWF
ncbi:universal stress protein [Fodinibius sp. AD559]|uniref:universal stress protein n=1 Tax=Fodinibius sp. AD559 TaxID=3424179 RepID=UPI004046AA02